MLNVVANFVLALIATLFVAGVAKWIAGRFIDERSKIASFAVGCGYVIGKYSFVKPLGTDISANIAALAGASVALLVLWLVLFRRKDHATTH